MIRSICKKRLLNSTFLFARLAQEDDPEPLKRIEWTWLSSLQDQLRRRIWKICIVKRDHPICKADLGGWSRSDSNSAIIFATGRPRRITHILCKNRIALFAEVGWYGGTDYNWAIPFCDTTNIQPCPLRPFMVFEKHKTTLSCICLSYILLVFEKYKYKSSCICLSGGAVIWQGLWRPAGHPHLRANPLKMIHQTLTKRNRNIIIFNLNIT